MTINRFSSAPPSRRGHIVAAIVVGVIALVTAAFGAWLLFGDMVLSFPISNTDRAPHAPVPSTQAAVLNLPAEAFSPLNLRALSNEDAMAYNQSLTVAALPNPPARPFNFVGSETDFNNAVDCLASAIYYEARSEPADGQRAVAQVVLNRLRHPQYPKSVCAVVFQGAERNTGCQFTFTCDNNMAGILIAEPFKRARVIAEQALRGAVYGPVGGATHYHAAYVVPVWADSLVKVRTIGLHIFYRWPANAGLPAAFTGRQQGPEAFPTKLAALLIGTALERPVEPPAPDVPLIITGSLDQEPEPAQVRPSPSAEASLLPAPVVAPPLAVQAPPAPTRPAPTGAAPPVNRRVPFTRSNW